MLVFSLAMRKPMFVRIFAEELVVLIRCASASRRSVILEHAIMANWMNQFSDVTCAYTQLWIKWDHANQSDRSQWLSDFFCFTRIFIVQWTMKRTENFKILTRTIGLSLEDTCSFAGHANDTNKQKRNSTQIFTQVEPFFIYAPQLMRNFPKKHQRTKEEERKKKRYLRTCWDRDCTVAHFDLHKCDSCSMRLAGA